MATTPEGRVKREIRKMLNKYDNRIYQVWPVPTGYGAATLDCLVCVGGMFIGIEAKAPGMVPTPRQKEIMRRMNLAGAETFVVDGEKSLAVLDDFIAKWLKEFNK